MISDPFWDWVQIQTPTSHWWQWAVKMYKIKHKTLRAWSVRNSSRTHSSISGQSCVPKQFNDFPPKNVALYNRMHKHEPWVYSLFVRCLDCWVVNTWYVCIRDWNRCCRDGENAVAIDSDHFPPDFLFYYCRTVWTKFAVSQAEPNETVPLPDGTICMIQILNIISVSSWSVNCCPSQRVFQLSVLSLFHANFR